MTKNILIGTGNKHKLKEISQMLDFPAITFKSLNDFSGLIEPEENGISFAENATIKARDYFRQTGIPCIADDSGLVVPALDNRPGIYSSRYAGDKATDMENDIKLLTELGQRTDRDAYYMCVIAFVDAKNEICFEGRFNGFIGHDFKGVNGFGYDPIFYFDDQGVTKSVAQLTDDAKNRISHRANALKEFRPWFKNYLEKELA